MWLMKIRDDKKMTQTQLAQQVGISRQMISAIEKGERRPSVEVAQKIANVLGFDWTEFFNEKVEV